MDNEELKRDVSAKKAERKYQQYNKAAEVLAQKKQAFEAQERMLQAEIKKGTAKIDNLAQKEMLLIQDLSST